MERAETDNGGSRLNRASYGNRVAEMYDELYSVVSRRSELAATVDFLRAHAGSGPVLELGIGTGRVALPLAAAGVTVVGIDASLPMLDRLRAKAGGPGIVVAVGDFADVDAPGGPFSLVYTVFNTFFCLDSWAAQMRCFSNVSGALSPGGLFIMETFVPHPARFDGGSDGEVTDRAEDTVSLGVLMHDPGDQQVRINTLDLGPDGLCSYLVELRYAWPEQLDQMAGSAELELAERWGTWSGTAFTLQSAAHVSVWRKSGA
ncbi:MAG: class I SAM-dependent DNA methyltransferase [Frankia sp.]